MCERAVYEFIFHMLSKMKKNNVVGQKDCAGAMRLLRAFATHCSINTQNSPTHQPPSDPPEAVVSPNGGTHAKVNDF